MKQFQATTTDTECRSEHHQMQYLMYHQEHLATGNIIKGQTTGVRAKLIDTVVDDQTEHLLLLSW